MEISMYAMLIGFGLFILSILVGLVIYGITDNPINFCYTMFVGLGIIVLHCVFIIVCTVNINKPENWEVTHTYQVISYNDSNYYIDDDNKMVYINLSNTNKYATDKPSYVEFKVSKYLWLSDTKATYYINTNE